jgi:hypothetical protein
VLALSLIIGPQVAKSETCLVRNQASSLMKDAWFVGAKAKWYMANQKAEDLVLNKLKAYWDKTKVQPYDVNEVWLVNVQKNGASVWYSLIAKNGCFEPSLLLAIELDNFLSFWKVKLSDFTPVNPA